MATRKRSPVPPEVGKESEIYAVVAALDHIQASTDELRKFAAGHADRTAEDKAEIETLREANKELRERNDGLLGKIDELEEKNAELDDSTENMDHIRDQLEQLAIGVDRPSAPQTPEQWARCLREILRGADWEAGTWR